MTQGSYAPIGVASLVVLAVIAASTLLAPWLTPYEPLAMDYEKRLLAPSFAHPFGTDLFGRDVLSRVLHGARISLLVGLLAALLAALPGLLLGLLSGYCGGWFDQVVMRLTDLALAFPSLILALGIVAILDPGLVNVTIAVGVAGVPGYVRLVRGSVLSVKEMLYVEAAQAIGCGHRRIILRHILPNILASVLVLATMDVAWAILRATSLSFLGLGAQPPTPEWGAMIDEGRELLRRAPWVSLAPSTVMMLAVLSLNLVGDALRDAMDPHTDSY
ncbi:MAG: ABC transporter permease [Anaerolineae bacterium]|jgi:ABC-type dipeptide/oligopeptide/nickel transport system permease subunit